MVLPPRPYHYGPNRFQDGASTLVWFTLQINTTMKDLRDLMNMIEEGQYAFDDSHPYFDGVWDSFKKIHNLSVPDAVITPSPEVIRHQNKRRVSANIPKVKNAMLGKTNESDFADFDRDGGPGGNPGGDDDD